MLPELPIVCFSETDKFELLKLLKPDKIYSLKVKSIEGLEIVEEIRLKDLGPKYYCYPMMPEDCSNCRWAESSWCSRWWQGDWSEDRPLPEEEEENFTDYKSFTETTNTNYFNDNQFGPHLYLKVWSKRNKIARTLALIGCVTKNELVFRTALIAAQFVPSCEVDEYREFIKRVHQSDITFMKEFLPEIIELPVNRREVKIFKKVLNKALNKVLKSKAQIEKIESIAESIADSCADSWGLDKEIFKNWFHNVLKKLEKVKSKKV